MHSVDRQVTEATLTRIAFYARVSTEEQAEKDTAANQIQYLHRKYAADFADDSPVPMTLIGTFVDEGYSGALRLEDRPDGKRLLELARIGQIDAIVVYRLDRLGRTAKVLLDAHEMLERMGVAILSATEPFDTRTSIGRFVFQLLGSIAELERETIRERMTLGRDRVARTGRFINGAIPYGYDLDVHDVLVLSTRLVESTGTSEAEIARQIIARVADGHSGASVARWLNAHGVPATTRYHRTGGAIRETRSGEWRRDRVIEMVRGTTYRGQRVLHHAGGDIEQSVPPIVDEMTWKRANAQLDHGLGHPLQTALYTYLLRGRIYCGLCGSALQGNYKKSNGRLYYACLRAPGRSVVKTSEPCELGYVNGDVLEAQVLSEVDQFIADPDAAIDVLREQVRSANGALPNRELETRRLHARLRDNDEAKRDIMALIRQRKISREDAARDLDELSRETAEIRLELEQLADRAALDAAMELQLIDTAAMLQAIGAEWQRWREQDDRAQLQGVVQQLVVEVRCFPDGTSRRTYTFSQPSRDLCLSDGLQIGRQLQITRGVA
jgi:site-specific DNA recombinase